MALKTFDSAKWLSDHGYSDNEVGSAKAYSTTSTGLKIFDSKTWLDNHGYVTPTMPSFDAPPVEYRYDAGYQYPTIDYTAKIEDMKSNGLTENESISFWDGTKSLGQYVGGKLASGIANTEASWMNALDGSFKVINRYITNPIMEFIGIETGDYAHTLTSALQSVGKTVGLVSKDEPMKQTNALYDHYKALSTGYSEKVEPIQDRIENVSKNWGRALDLGGKIAESVPFSLQYAIPVFGTALGTVSGLSSGVAESFETKADSKLTDYQALERGLLHGEINSISELVFGLFDEVGSIFKSSTLGNVGEELAKKLGKTSMGKFLGVTMSILGSGVGEAAEEIIAYPFNQFVDWRYSNGMKPVEEYSSYFNTKDMLESGLVALLSGGMTTIGRIGYNSTTSAIAKKLINRGVELGSTNIDDFNDTETRTKAEEFVNDVADLVINDPKIATGEETDVASNVRTFASMPNLTESFERVGDNFSVEQPAIEEETTRQDIGENIGLHFGDLGKSEFLSNSSGDRGTGHYGTGTYFISENSNSYADMVNSKYSNYSKRPMNKVDFTNYNLYIPTNSNKASELHDFLKQINKSASSSNLKINSPQMLYQQALTLFGSKKIGSYESFIKTISDIITYAESNRDNDLKAYFNKTQRYDSPSTKFMKELGYDGIDVRGIKGFDNEQYGSVIYDLKKQTKTEIKETKVKTTKQITQITPNIAKELETLANKEPSKESIGVVSKSVQELIKDIPSTTTDTKYKGVFDPDVKKNLDDSMKIKHDTPLSQRLYNLKEFISASFLRGSVNIPHKYGELRQLVRQYRQANSAADTQVENFILRTYNPVGKGNYELMRNTVVFMDLAEDIADGLYDNNRPLPFGIKSKSDALQMISDVSKKADGNSLVSDAMNKRRKIMQTMRNQLVSTAKEIGYDLSYLQNRSDYMHHAILEYIDESSREKHKKSGKSSAYKERYGSYKNYVSDPALADYLVMRKMLKDMMKFNLYNELKTLDIKDTLELDKDGKYIVPNGYSEFDRHTMGLNYVDAINANPELMPSFIESVKDQLGDIPQDVIDKIKTASKENRNETILVIPSDVKNTIQKEFELKTSDQFPNFQKIITQYWKKWQLESPRRIIKYNVKNFAGDTDAMLMIYPQSVKKIAKSFKELSDFYKTGKITENLSEYSWLGGLSSSLSTVELGDLQSMSNFTFYESEQSIGKLAVNKFRRIIRSMENFTEWREQLLRYASFMQLKEELQNSKNGLPKDYGASIPEEIKTIKTIGGKAYKLSNDALGAYNDVTPMAQGMSKTIYPFFRFKEVNLKRFYRLAKNTFYNDSESVLSTGESVANKFAKGAKISAIAALKIGKIALGLGAFNLALALWNGFVAPDEEDELPEDIKKSPHIVFPRWATGGEIFYYNDLSSFYQLFDDMGFDGFGDIYNDMREIISGKMTLGDKVKEIATAEASAFIGGTAPFYRPVMEAIVGKSIYPDISKPSAVHDPWEHLFKSIGLENEYKKIAGKSLPNGSYVETFKKAIANSVMPGESAMYDTYDAKERFYESQDKKMPSGFSKDKKAMAIYNYKTALKSNDTVAAEKYIKEYAIYGGTQATYQKSMDALDPLFGMSSVDKKKFIDGMTSREREQYNKAIDYIESIKDIGNPSSLPRK